MATRYKLYPKDQSGNARKSVQRILDDGTISSIPFVNENIDYQVYLQWEKTNTVEAADGSPTDWDFVREKRDRLLRNSDWTMTTGATVDQAQWSAYREKLRDIPQTYKNVSDPLTEVVWPTIPSSKGPNS